MGSIIQANCECVYKSDLIYAGGGMANFEETLNTPALCKNCYTFTVRNYFSKDNYCSKCESKITFYDNKSLWKDKDVSLDKLDSIFYWSIDISNNTAFILPNTMYLCPKCRKFKMKFNPWGNWD